MSMVIGGFCWVTNRTQNPEGCTIYLDEISLNGDHILTVADAAIALQIAVGRREYGSRWDVSGDGQITSLDALMILQAAAGGISL